MPIKKITMYRVIEMTKDEKRAMYMDLPKEQIIELLLNCNEVLDSQFKSVISDLTCDNCGCHPNTIYTTSKGRFCEGCKPVYSNLTK